MKRLLLHLQDWRGDYLIAYSSEIFANGKKGGTDTDCLGKQNNNVKPESNLSEDGNIVSATWGDEYYVTLEKIDDSNTYLLKTQDGKYNYQSSNSNGLSATDNKSTAAKYPISVNFVSANEINLALGGDADGAVFRYNTDGYFRFYKNGGQKAIYLYKKQEATYSDYCTDVSYTRDVNTENIGTLCVPYAFEKPDYMTLYNIVCKDDSKIYFKENEDEIEAGKPYLFRSTEENITLIYTGEKADEAGKNNGLVGTFEGCDIDANAENYILSNNTLYVVDSDFKCGANRAYIHLDDVSDYNPSDAKADFTLDFNEPTGITSYENDNDNENLKAMTVYNLNGMRVNDSYKGIVVVNGKKFINK